MMNIMNGLDHKQINLGGLLIKMNTGVAGW